MKKTNYSYCIVVRSGRWTERYYRDADGRLKVSARGRVFRATAEQVLNHLLPALSSGDRVGPSVEVEHYEEPYWRTLQGRGRSDEADS